MRPHWWIAGIGIGNSFATSYFGKALMYTLITQRGEVSGFVRILHQVLGCHMTNVMYIYSTMCTSYLSIHTAIHNQSTNTTIILVLLYTQYVVIITRTIKLKP